MQDLEDMAKTKKETKEEERLLKLMRDRYTVMYEADSENLRMAMDDMEFINVPGKQWDQYIKNERGDRPCYEFNKIRVTAKRIINDMRANRVQGKVRAVEDGDKEIADILEGLCRNIWDMSDGDTIMDYECEYQVSAGMGAVRVVTEYAHDAAFYQDIKVEAIQNPFCLLHDPGAKDIMKRDAADWILSEKIPKAEFKARWPNADTVSFDNVEFDVDDEWSDEESVRVAEYWYKEPIKKEIYLMEDGKVLDSTDEAAIIIKRDNAELIKKTRTVNSHKIMMFIASGVEILEGPTEWAGSTHPFVKIYGEYIIVNGRVYWFGIGRFAKDAQRSYNVSRTAITETIAMAPQSKFWATPAQAEGHTDKWAKAHKENYPFLLANADPKQPGFPQRMGGADVPIALIQESQLASEEIKAVTGIFSTDMGAPNSATSGRQEIARQQQGEVATFNYKDNRGKGMQRIWEILLDLIPRVYDTERELRVLGSDDAENYVRVNQFVRGDDGEMVKVNDLTKGRYDTTITTGPSFSTKRQEAAEIYQQLTQGNPAIFPVIGDLIFKALDLPYSEDIAERLQVMLPPEIQQLIAKDNQGDIPPEVRAMMQQAQQAMQMVEQQAQEVQQAAQQADLDKAEVEKLIANLKTEEANFKAQVAQEMAKLAQKESQFTVKQVENERSGLMEEGEQVLEAERQQYGLMLADMFAKAVEEIQAMAAQFNDYAIKAIADIEQHEADKPKVVKIESKRENGKLVAIPVYDKESK